MKKRRASKVVIDTAMLGLLVVLMSYQIMDQGAHGWLGAGMLAAVVAHHVLNWKWYASILKGRYAPFRAAQAGIDLALIPVAALTLASGIVMSDLFRVADLVAWARVTHLCCSTWFSVLIGLHLGMHMSGSAGRSGMLRPAWGCLLTLAAAYGAWQFVRLGMPSRMLLLTEFAVLDYESPAALVLLQCAAMVWLWAWAGLWAGRALRRGARAV